MFLHRERLGFEVQGLGFWVQDIRDYVGIMENDMETTIVYWGLYGDNGTENGNHRERCY